MLNIPAVQHRISVAVSRELSEMLGARLTVGRIDMGLLNRIIVSDLQLQDRSGKDMLKVARLSAKFDILPLFSGKISIGTVQLFGFDVKLEKERPDAALNCQFVIDTFASNDTVKKDMNLDLRVNSLLIRRGKVAYDVLSEAETRGKFNPNHIDVRNIIANISLKALRGDTLNATVKRMSAEEAASGFRLKKLNLKALGNEKQISIADFQVELPDTEFKADTIFLRYDSLEAFRSFADKVHLSFRLHPSKVTLKDFAAFLPAFSEAGESLQLRVGASGTLNDLKCSGFYVASPGNHFWMAGDVSLQYLSDPDNALLFGQVTGLRADQLGMAFLLRNFMGAEARMPAVLRNMGTASFQGQLSGYFTDLVTYGTFRTDVGTVFTDLKLSSDKERGVFSYSGGINTSDFNLGQMTGNGKLGKITFNLSVAGNHHRHRSYPSVILKGNVASVDYSGYQYNNIHLDGEYKDGGFYGKASLDDPNGSISLDGLINTVGKIPTYNFKAAIDHLRPHALNIAAKDIELSARINADFTGRSVDDMEGSIGIDSLLLVTADGRKLTDSLRIEARNVEGGQQRRLTLRAGFADILVHGGYSYRTLSHSVRNVLNRYIPSLVDSVPGMKGKKTDNNFSFDMRLHNTRLLSAALEIPFHTYVPATFKGYFNDKIQRLHLEGYLPRFHYKGKFFESGMVLCENVSDHFHARLRFTHRKNNSAVSMSVDAKARHDSIQTFINWGNDQAVTYSGQLSALACFRRPFSLQTDSGTETPASGGLKTVVHIRPTDIILNDTVWRVEPATVEVDSGKVRIDGFNFSHGPRHLSVNGVLSKDSKDTVRIDLQDINIGYVFDIANLGVSFQGEATGPAYASGVLGKPVMYTDLNIRRLGLNNALLGDARIHGEWHHDVKGIWLDADIREADVAQTRVNGYIYPIKPTSSLDLDIRADGTNLKFIHHYMRNITSDFRGRVSGRVRLYGKFKALTMEGKVDADASMKVDVLNTTLNVRDSVLIVPEGLTLTGNRLYDEQGHQGRISGTLRYDHFRHIRYDFRADVQDMLVMHTQESSDFPFYGTVYGTGNVNLRGNAQEGLNVDVAMTTGTGTTFTYVKDYVNTATSNQFIRFVDKTPRRAAPDSIYVSAYEQARQRLSDEADDTKADIRLNLLVDVTPDATMRIIMDPVAGDYISAQGSGSLRTEFYNKGDVSLFGSYRISRGLYKFSLQEVIRKDFVIADGSTIAFNGAPLDASLDIKASYTVSSASLNDLIPDAADFVNQTNVRVNCLMDITGQLTAPEISLDLELPNENDEVQALVRNYIPTDEQMNMQILYLLGIGKFYTETPGVSQNSDMMSSVLSSTLSGQLNNALSRIIDNHNWNIGTNLSTGENGWTDMEFEGVLSGQLLNNRLLINGNFGYRENPVANTNFVGDFDAEWLVNRSGDIRLKAYNETNDRYYTKTNLTTQGIGIIFKKDFDRWRELFFWDAVIRKRRQRREREAREKEQTSVKPTDSESAP